jgi:transcriptional regulator with XRE-family HTH domain
MHNEFDSIFNFENKEDKWEVEAKILASKFLSIIQKELDKNDGNRKELAESIGTSASYITQLFRGNKYPNFLTLAKIKEVLNIDFSIALEGEINSQISEDDISQYLNKFYQSHNGDYIKIIKNKPFNTKPNRIKNSTSPYNFSTVDYQSA